MEHDLSQVMSKTLKDFLILIKYLHKIQNLYKSNLSCVNNFERFIRREFLGANIFAL